MKDLFIVGCGGFGLEVLFIIKRNKELNKKWRNIHFVDDNSKLHHKEMRGVNVIGGVDDLKNYNDASEIDVVIAINNCDVRKQVVEKLKSAKAKINYPNIIDCSSIIDTSTLQIGQGNIIMNFVILSVDVSMGNFNILNSYTSFGHGASVANFNTFNPRVAISGNVNIGNENSFGISTIVIQNKNIGSYNETWVNSSIMRNIGDKGIYFGIPAKKIN